MTIQERMPFAPKNFWTHDEKILLGLAKDQTASIQESVAKGERWSNSANFAINDTLQKLKNLLAIPGLTQERQDELKTIFDNLDGAIPDSFEPSVPKK